MDAAHQNPAWHAAAYVTAEVRSSWLTGPGAGKIRFNLSSVNTAPNARVIHAVGDRGFPNGVDIGFRCNKLFIDTSLAFNAFFYRADSSGTARSGDIFVPWSESWRGQTIWAQGAWQDSKTMRPSLTRAMSLTIPNVSPEHPRHKHLFSFKLPNQTNRASFVFRVSASPLVLYTYR